MAPPMEDPNGGPNASMGFGDASQFASERQAVASTSGPAQPGTPPPPQPQQPPQQQPGQPQQGGPVQPQQPPPPQPQGPGQGRLDLNNVFPPMPEIDNMDKAPWRMQLRTWAYHPDAGPALKKLADLIDKQHGPNY